MCIDFLLKITCSECNNLQCKYGLCHEHYSIEKCNNILNNLYNLTLAELFLNKNNINVKLKTIKFIFNKFKNKINKGYLNCQYLYKETITNEFKFLKNYDYSNLITISYNDIIEEYLNFDVDELINLYKKCNNNFKNLKEIHTYFNKLSNDNIETDIEYLKDLRICNNKLLELRQIIQKMGNNLIYLLYERKLLKNKKYILNEIIKYKYDNNYQKIIGININNLNSYKLFRYILTNDICKHILILTCEYKIKINKRSLYCDIYMIIRTLNNICLEAIIEIDEKQHFNTTIIPNKRDIIKDLYAFQNGISLLRISTNEITNDTIITVINFINKIVNIQKPYYDINSEYIIHKQKILNEYIIPYDKKHNITSIDFLNNKYVTSDINNDDKGIYIELNTDELNDMKKIYDSIDTSTITNLSDIEKSNPTDKKICKNVKNILINEHEFNNMTITFGSRKNNKNSKYIH